MTASNGISIAPDCRPADDPPADYIVVCSGGDADQLNAPAVFRIIRGLSIDIRTRD